MIGGLLITGADRGDIGAILAEVRALPGQTGLPWRGWTARRRSRRASSRSGPRHRIDVQIVHSRARPADPRRRAAGYVVTLDIYSIPSGMLQTWPTGSR
jgi:hypothetical protein